jgi:hypothetical protein
VEATVVLATVVVIKSLLRNNLVSFLLEILDLVGFQMATCKSCFFTGSNYIRSELNLDDYATEPVVEKSIQLSHQEVQEIL